MSYVPAQRLPSRIRIPPKIFREAAREAGLTMDQAVAAMDAVQARLARYGDDLPTLLVDEGLTHVAVELHSEHERLTREPFTLRIAEAVHAPFERLAIWMERRL